jgi:hypothetical protein
MLKVCNFRKEIPKHHSGTNGDVERMFTPQLRYF